MENQEELKRKEEEIEELKRRVEGLFFYRSLPEDLRIEIEDIFMQYNEILEEGIHGVNRIANDNVLFMHDYEEDIIIHKEQVLEKGIEIYTNGCYEKLANMNNLINHIEERSIEEPEESEEETLVEKQKRFYQGVDQQTQEEKENNQNNAERLANEIIDRLNSCEQMALRRMGYVIGRAVEQYREDVNELRHQVKLETTERIAQILEVDNAQIQGQLEEIYGQYIEDERSFQSKGKNPLREAIRADEDTLKRIDEVIRKEIENPEEKDREEQGQKDSPMSLPGDVII